MSLLLSLLAGVLAGQMPDNSSMLPPRQVRALIADYGDCIVKRAGSRAAEAILAGESGDIMRSYPQLVQETCVSTKLGDQVRVSFRGNQYRYTIAEALVRRQLASAPPPVLDDVPPLEHEEAPTARTVDDKGRPLAGQKLEAALRSAEVQQASRYMWRFGECVVRVDPTAAKQLLLSEPETVGEAAAFAALNPALGTCVSEGRKLEFGKAALRGTIAVNYYRLAIAASRMPAQGAPR